MNQRVLELIKRVIPWIGAGFFVLAVALAHREFKQYHVSRIRDLLLSVRPRLLIEAVLITAAGYFTLIFYDRLALAALSRKVGFLKTAFAAFSSFAVSHNAGHAWLSGSSLRYRFYVPDGVSGTDILKLMFLNSIAYGLGLCSLLLGACIWQREYVQQTLRIPGLNLLVGLSALLYLSYGVMVTVWRPVLFFKQFEMRLPSLRVTLAQAFVGSCDIGLSALVLYVLLFSDHPAALSEFLIVYIVALLLGVASQVPGGLGVFETTFLHFLSYRYPATGIVASLILYRIIYYFLPLAVAGAMFVGYEIFSARPRSRPAGKVP